MSKTELAREGILKLRERLTLDADAPQRPISFEEEAALTALCDYAERAIAARARGGSKPKPRTSAQNGKLGGRRKLSADGE